VVIRSQSYRFHHRTGEWKSHRWFASDPGYPARGIAPAHPVYLWQSANGRKSRRVFKQRLRIIRVQTIGEPRELSIEQPKATNEVSFAHFHVGSTSTIILKLLYPGRPLTS